MKTGINKEETLKEIQAGMSEAQFEIDDANKRLSNLKDLQYLVESDDPKAISHFDAHWAVVYYK